ncbi:MAG: hypothetical protein QOE90_934 [Thermoplasmata archaeon]|jgi:hypothetical protein|nr:hypothetical protein [Thermoplasmata archaeon]
MSPPHHAPRRAGLREKRETLRDQAPQGACKACFASWQYPASMHVYRWKGALISIAACDAHRAEVFAALDAAQGCPGDPRAR